MNNRYREEEKLEQDNIIKEDELSNNLSDDETLDLDKSSEENMSFEEENPLEDNEENLSKKEKNNRKVRKLEEKLVEKDNEINKLKDEVKSVKEQYMRTLADTENFKKRIDDERIRERKYGSQRLLEKLITSIDIFDKAVNMKTDDPNLGNFLLGFQMINNQLKQVLEEEGVKKIVTTTKFDPHYHDAIDTDYDETKEEGDILMVIKDGYMYKDRVLSPALVKVNKKPVE